MNIYCCLLFLFSFSHLMGLALEYTEFVYEMLRRNASRTLRHETRTRRDKTGIFHSRITVIVFVLFVMCMSPPVPCHFTSHLYVLRTKRLCTHTHTHSHSESSTESEWC